MIQKVVMWARLTADDTDDTVSLSDRLNKMVRAGQQLTVDYRCFTFETGCLCVACTGLTNYSQVDAHHTYSASVSAFSLSQCVDFLFEIMPDGLRRGS